MQIFYQISMQHYRSITQKIEVRLSQCSPVNRKLRIKLFKDSQRYHELRFMFMIMYIHYVRILNVWT